MLSTAVRSPLAQEEQHGGLENLMGGGKDKAFTPFDDASDLVPDEIASVPELEELFAGQDFGSELFDEAKLDFKKSEDVDEFGDSELPQDFSEKTGLPITVIQTGLDEAERKGLIERDFARVRPTERGFDFLNDLQALFLAG